MIFSPRHPALLITLAGAALTGYVPAAHAPTGDTGPAAPARAPAVVTVEASDYALSLPAQVPAGVVTFRLVNNGKELHHAQVIRLESGKTAGDYMKAYTDKGAMPGWVRYLGGPAGTPSGQEHHSTTVLTPGHYVVMCRIASPDGVIHLMKGMIREFDVVATGGDPEASLPAATDTVRLNDYGFVSHRPLTTGHHTIRVENDGPQPHEIVMLKLAPGKTPADFASWGLGTRDGPPPGMPIGGVEFLDQGAAGVFPVALGPGDYGFICFVPDEKDGKRHFLHGMTAQFRLP
jgi:hypothetical protein